MEGAYAAVVPEGIGLGWGRWEGRNRLDSGRWRGEGFGEVGGRVVGWWVGVFGGGVVWDGLAEGWDGMRGRLEGGVSSCRGNLSITYNVFWPRIIVCPSI